jgi:hypothetical protein
MSKRTTDPSPTPALTSGRNPTATETTVSRSVTFGYLRQLVDLDLVRLRGSVALIPHRRGAGIRQRVGLGACPRDVVLRLAVFRLRHGQRSR